MVLERNGVEVLDLHFLGKPGAIAAGLITGGGRPAIVDPGPTSSLAGLRQALAGRGLAVGDIEAILITHIHLDHAGGTGTLVGENPRLQVYVHRRGARHLIDPARLIESARRLYKDDMDRLWGEMLPVPPDNVHALAGGERLAVAGRVIEVLETPGHAWHHVSYFDPASGVVFAGDAGGIHVGSHGYLLPPTPPPDIDVEAWSASIAKIIACGPEALFVTHFGLVEEAVERLRALERRLRFCAEVVRESLERGPTDRERIRHFAEAMTADLRRHMSAEEAAQYEDAMPLDHCWHGLARYWRTKD